MILLSTSVVGIPNPKTFLDNIKSWFGISVEEVRIPMNELMRKNRDSLIATKSIKQNEKSLVQSQELQKFVRRQYVPDEILVKFKEGVLPEKAESIIQEFRVSKLSKIKKLGVHRLKIPAGITVPEIVKRFKKNPFVEFAEPNYIAYASMVPNDPLYSYQWHFDNPTYHGIHMESAWDVTTGNSNIVVAVVDTGVAYENYPAPAHWHIDAYNAYGGSGYSWWGGIFNTDWPNSPGYGNGWKDYLQHSFDLTSATGTVTFSFQHRYDMEGGYDYAYTEVSSNGGLSWDDPLKTYTGQSKAQNKIVWVADSIDLTSYKGKNILLRFRFNSDESVSDEDGHLYRPQFDSDGAWYIDEVKLEDGSGTLFYDDMESWAGSWETTQYEKAPDLAGTSFVAGYDFVNNDSHPNDDEGHGTHVTGTIAQTTNNNLGVAGIAFNPSIMPVKVLGADGSGTYDMVANGIIYAVDNWADIISMSLGGSSSSTTLENAVNYAYSNGVTVIAACGNRDGELGYTGGCDYPAAYSNVTSVGATQYNETKAPYSSYGSTLDLVAPGGNIGVDQNNDGYGDGVLQQTFGDTPVDWSYWFYQGTSMSTPHVSGVAALLLAQDSSLTPDDIRNVLQSTAEDLGEVGWDQYYGHGLVNASIVLNNTPTAVALGPSTGIVNVPLQFDGSQSYDPDNDTLTYYWQFGDNNNSTIVKPIHTYSIQGIYPVNLTVTDYYGLYDDDSLTVNILPDDSPQITGVTLTVNVTS